MRYRFPRPPTMWTRSCRVPVLGRRGVLFVVLRRRRRCALGEPLAHPLLVLAEGPGASPSRATRKQKEHLYRCAFTRGGERTATRHSADDCQTEPGVFRVLPARSCSVPVICHDNFQLVTDLADRHDNITVFSLRVRVPHDVGDGFADTEFDRADLLVRKTQIASNGLGHISEGPDAVVLSNIGGCLQGRRQGKPRTTLVTVSTISKRSSFTSRSYDPARRLHESV